MIQYSLAVWNGKDWKFFFSIFFFNISYTQRAPIEDCETYMNSLCKTSLTTRHSSTVKLSGFDSIFRTCLNFESDSKLYVARVAVWVTLDTEPDIRCTAIWLNFIFFESPHSSLESNCTKFEFFRIRKHDQLAPWNTYKMRESNPGN